MTDEQLAQYLGIRQYENWQALIDHLGPKRAVYERMAQVEIEIALWQKGLGPRPRGVLIDGARTPRRAKAVSRGLRKRWTGQSAPGADR